MKLAITARLTLATALLTLVFLLPAAGVLYLGLAEGIRADATRRVEQAVGDLAFRAVHQWNEGLLDRGGERQLRSIGLDAPHWAVVRGDRRLITARGLFVDQPSLVVLGESQRQALSEGTFRTASTPLFSSLESFEHLPPAVRDRVCVESPDGAFLRSKREVKRGETVLEVLLLEGDHILELELGAEGEVIDRDHLRLLDSVPPDLAALIQEHDGLQELGFASWQVYQGQLIAVVHGRSPTGATKWVALNRLGERFLLDETGRIQGPEAASRLWLVTALDATEEVAAVRRLRAAVALGFPLLWSSLILVGWLVTRRAMSPVQRIVDTVEQIEVTRLDERLPVGAAADELARISRTINRMLERIEKGYQRERQFTGDASHELRGPLAKIIADIDVALAKERAAPDYRATLVRCRSYAQSMQDLVESLLWLARLDACREPLEGEGFELTDVAAEVIKQLPPEQASRVQLDLRGESVVTAHGSPELVRVMLHNLLQNAIRYSPDGTRVVLRISTENGTSRVDVEDRGGGIPDEQLERVFSRFFRLDAARSRDTGGFGLGLAIVGQIARVHGIDVALANRSGGGLQASFCLPVGRRD